MDRNEYKGAMSYLRRVRHILLLRYAAARINPEKPNEIIFPAVDNVLPKKFK